MKATLDDYKSFLDGIATATGNPDFKSNDEGFVTLTTEKYELNLQFIPASGKIIAFSQVTELPESASKAVYRELLAAGLFGQETAGGNFAIESTTNAVIYSYLFDFDPETTQADAFVDTLDKIIELVDMWNERILHTLETSSDEPTTGAPEDVPLPGMDFLRA